MKNNNPRGSNELSATLARAVRLLEFLRDNTDKENKISQSKLFKAGGEDHIFGAKKTLIKTIVALADALNGLKPKEEWLLNYKGFDKHYDDCDGDNDGKMPTDVTDIYFNHIFSETELTAIINALNTSKAVNKAEAETIIGKLVKNLARKEYKEKYEKHMYKLDFSEPSDSQPGDKPEPLSENISKIQRAITA